MRTLSEQEYVLFQAAKGIWQSQRTVTIPELCDRKLVEDKTFGVDPECRSDRPLRQGHAGL